MKNYLLLLLLSSAIAYAGDNQYAQASSSAQSPSFSQDVLIPTSAFDQSLYFAAGSCNVDDVRRFLKDGADPNYQHDNGVSVLHATLQATPERALLNERKKNNETWKHLEQVVALLLEHGARPGDTMVLKQDISHHKTHGNLLHWASDVHNVAVTQLLLEQYKATFNIDAQDSNGNTAAHLAVYAAFRMRDEDNSKWANCYNQYSPRKLKAIIGLLHKHKADFTITDQYGNTPIQIAYQQKLLTTRDVENLNKKCCVIL